ncbi:MAG: hypothetical protein LAQ30_29580 [Acidobacteriia bacterium]|nr:hypothetical protein [Terriglobia bacterium]
MTTAPPVEPLLAAPRTLSFCAACGEHTPHELVQGDGVIAKVCVRCAERALTNLLGRD